MWWRMRQGVGTTGSIHVTNPYWQYEMSLYIIKSSKNNGKHSLSTSKYVRNFVKMATLFICLPLSLQSVCIQLVYLRPRSVPSLPLSSSLILLCFSLPLFSGQSPHLKRNPRIYGFGSRISYFGSPADLENTNRGGNGRWVTQCQETGVRGQLVGRVDHGRPTTTLISEGYIGKMVASQIGPTQRLEVVKRLLNGSYYFFDLPFHMLCVGALTQRQMIMCLLDSKLEALQLSLIHLLSIYTSRHVWLLATKGCLNQTCIPSVRFQVLEAKDLLVSNQTGPSL